MTLTPHAWSSPAHLPAMDDPQLILFYRQYLQQIRNLTYPPEKLLLEPDVQNQIYKHFFDGPLKGPPNYQRKVLKKIIDLIERAIPEDNVHEYELSSELAEHISYLSTFPSTTASDPILATQSQTITYTLPESLSNHHPPTIVISEFPNLLAAGSNVGLRTWEAALHLATYMHAHCDLIREQTVIELGAGTGLISILSSLLGARHVLSTDGLPHVVESIEANIDRNRLLSTLPSTSTLQTRVLDWSDNDPSSLEDALSSQDVLQEYNLILGADITYAPDVVPILAQLLSVLITDLFAHNRIEALISATVRNETTLSVFRESCTERGLKVEDVEFSCPGIREQRGFFHEQAFPIVIMRIAKA